MDEQWTELFANLPAYLGGHMRLSMAALAAALAISLPLGVLASRRPRLGESVLAIAGVVQTVPSLALLGLMMLVLGGMIGFWPAFLTLVVYSVLPILANTVIGIRGVDPLLTEAARGLGMNDRQMLWRVELPLAAPVILGGVRTATVLIVGTATLATSIAADSLGNYIFAGLATLNHTATLFGCLATALLAIGLDQLVHLLEIAARRRSKTLAYVATTGLLLVGAGGAFEPVKRWMEGGDDDRVVIAAGAYSEQYILSHALAQNLEAAGFRPDRREGMVTGIQLLALQSNDADCLVTYTGDIWTLVMKRQKVESPERTQSEVTRYLREEFGGIVCLGALGFDNRYALAMKKDKKDAWKVTSIADLIQYGKKHGRRLTIGGDIGIFERKEWHRLKVNYQIRDQDVKTTAMEQALNYTAVSEGKVDAIIAYTSDARITAFNLELLDDPDRVFPPYDAILVVSPAAARREKLMAALAPLVGKIDQKTILAANGRVDIEHDTPRSAATWLLSTIQKGKHP